MNQYISPKTQYTLIIKTQNSESHNKTINKVQTFIQKRAKPNNHERINAYSNDCYREKETHILKRGITSERRAGIREKKTRPGLSFMCQSLCVYAKALTKRKKIIIKNKNKQMGCACDDNRMVFVAGGHDDEKNALKSVIAYDITKDELIPFPEMA